MDRIRTILDCLLNWVSLVDKVPVVYAAQDRIPVRTRPSPFLELGFHSSGSESTLEVPGIRRESRPGTLAILNAHAGNSGTPRDTWGFWCVSLDTSRGPPEIPWDTPILETLSMRHPAHVLARFEDVGRQHRHSVDARTFGLKAARGPVGNDGGGGTSGTMGTKSAVNGT